MLVRAISERAACVPQCEHLQGADDTGAVQKHLCAAAPSPSGPFAACPYPLLVLVSSSFFLPSPLGIFCFVIFFNYLQIIWFLAIYILTLLSFFSEGRGTGGGDLLFCSVLFRRLVGREGIRFQPHSMIEVRFLL